MTEGTGDGGDTATEIAKIEQTMKSDFGAYRNDQGLQDRYGELLGKRETAARKAEEAGGSASDPISTEIASIEKRMQTDFMGYMLDKTMRDRYEELLEKRANSALMSLHNYGQPSNVVPLRPSAAPATPPADAGPGKHSVRPIEEIVADFNATPETAALVRQWGGDASANITYAATEAVEILNSMDPDSAAKLEAAVDALPAADYAKLMRSLADAGRAKGTR